MKSYAKEIEKYGIYSVPTWIDGVQYWVVMTKNLKHDRKEPYIYFISNIENAKMVLAHYLERWKIECCFRHLKSNGFDMEAMNLKTDNKIELMMGMVATAYVTAIREGMLKFIQKPFRIIKYKNGKEYYEVSVFRKGIEILEAYIFDMFSFLKYLLKTLKYAEDNPFNDKIIIKNVH